METWKEKTIIYTILMITIMACQNYKKVTDWSDKDINEWFYTSPWYTKLIMKPDESINKRLFVEQNIMNPSSWDAALRFLKDIDLNVLELGRYDLLDDGTYVNIDEYTTKDSAHFEAHCKYIDIQYLVNGEEYIFVTPLDPQKQKKFNSTMKKKI